MGAVLCCHAEAALRRGLQELVWSSDGIDSYTKDAVDQVRELDGVLTTIKDNVAATMQLLRGFEHGRLMFERKVCGIALGGRVWFHV